MAMAAGLIAELADVDLKDGDSSGTKREQANPIELRLKGWRTRDGPKKLQLFCRRGEGAQLSQKG
jgi:hypothetical protein